MPAASSNQFLVDSSFFIALSIHDDKFHDKARNFFEDRDISQLRMLVVDLVLVEVLYFLENRVSRPAAIAFQQKVLITDNISILSVDRTILRRSIQIRQQYENFDFVDSCIMACAEKHELYNILSFDHDFQYFRPIHIEHFTVLPE